MPLVGYLLADKGEYVRQVAAEALGEIGDPRAVESLLNALTDESVGVRAAAAWAVGKMAVPQAVPRLVYMLHEWDDEISEGVEWALEQIGQSAVEALIGAMQDTYVLCGIKDALKNARAFDALLTSLKASSAFVRVHALIALRDLDDPHACEAVKPLLEDPSEHIRRLASDVLLIWGKSP